MASTLFTPPKSTSDMQINNSSIAIGYKFYSACIYIYLSNICMHFISSTVSNTLVFETCMEYI